jgi:oxygen-independent coproporphyrinogen-3 oxidase
LPSEDDEADMFEQAIDTLKAHGYHHYEISNFAQPGKECLHNINYWENGDYIGVGVGAHSHLNGRRWSNPNCIEEYLKTASRITPNETRIATDQRETLFLGLRLLDGISTKHFAGFEKEVAELINDGLLEEKNGNFRLTRRGLFLGNMVFEKFV